MATEETEERRRYVTFREATVKGRIGQVLEEVKFLGNTLKGLEIVSIGNPSALGSLPAMVFSGEGSGDGIFVKTRHVTSDGKDVYAFYMPGNFTIRD